MATLRPAAVVAAALLLAAPAASASAPPKVAAKAYFVQNAQTDEVLRAYRARQRLPIASITKLATVLVALQYVSLDAVVAVSPLASAVGESTVDLNAGERIAVRDLVKAALIQSANDAAHALALHVGRGSESRFVALMNAVARALGMTATTFRNPSGLDAPGHLSTARDVTLLARRAMRIPAVRTAVDDRTATIAGGRRLYTWNDLLTTFPGTIGVKTGHTTAAGWSQVAAARGNGTVVYATILGSPTRARRNADLQALLRWALGHYRLVRVIDRGRVYARAATQYGRAPVALVPRRSVPLSVRVDRPLVERVVAPIEVELPVRRGQRLGEVRVYARGRIVARAPLVAARAIAKPGLADRLAWHARSLLP